MIKVTRNHETAQRSSSSRCVEHETLESRAGASPLAWRGCTDSLRKALGVWATSQPLIPRGERSGLLMHTGMMESVSLCVYESGIGNPCGEPIAQKTLLLRCHCNRGGTTKVTTTLLFRCGVTPRPARFSKQIVLGRNYVMKSHSAAVFAIGLIASTAFPALGSGTFTEQGA